MSDATVDIADVFADAVRVPVETVEPGDYVFDVYGGRHVVDRVMHYGSHGRLEVERADGWSSHHTVGDTITIVRGVSS